MFESLQARYHAEFRTQSVSRELQRLLEEQEKLLDLPMNSAEMTLYELRSEQIRELVQELMQGGA